MPGSLENKVVLVIGGGSGIGRATSLAFSREGAKVVVAEINSESGEETVSAIKESGGESIFVHVDVASATGVQEMISRVVKTYGRLDSPTITPALKETSRPGYTNTPKKPATALSTSTSRAFGFA